MTEPKPLYRYVGPDRFFQVPARDLTEDEFNALPVLSRLDVQANASYELVEPDKQTRDELNADARALGVDNPEGMKNKAEVIAAIEAAQRGQEGDN